jgi:MSHA biogenesis protein MshN
MVSVINQMLKDLDQRAPVQGQAAVPVANNNKPSTLKIILISLAVLVSLNLLGFYVWNLQGQATPSDLTVKEQIQTPEINVVQDVTEQPVETLKIAQQALERKELILEPKPTPIVELTQKTVVNNESNLAELPVDKIVEKKTLVKPQSVKPKQVSTLTKVPVVIAPTESKMSVSRRQLTPKELVAQKLVRAEKAIKINNIIKAEQLFEEVLIVDPTHKQARKKLAALWFGRKSYQQATNLLSRGISLDRSDEELRLLKARIHLQQGQHEAAYNTLKPLAMLKQKEYQVMLANVSQQIEQYESAIQAYKILIDMQSYSGRWHLGLAIIYDKNSQFSLAASEYGLALTKSDLSVASAEFAQQRMNALGE